MKHTTLNVRMHTNAWYETDFKSSFAALIAHKNHVGSIQLVRCLLPMAKVESQICKKLNFNVKRVVSVFHGNDHFAVMESNLDSNVITIYDGLNLALNNHLITNMLK